jgi:hypothetical protein
VYKRMGQKTASFNLGNSGEKFSVHWYDPRKGGKLQKGTVESVTSTGSVIIGEPSSEPGMDWVAILRKTEGNL